jgi:hypothetical protein
MEPDALKAATDLAAVTAHTAAIVSFHSYINHALLIFVVGLLGVIGWFGRATLTDIKKGIEKKADKETNDGDHKALFSHYHGVEIEVCNPDKKCIGETSDLMVRHGG